MEIVVPEKGEPIVQSSVDKFWKTETVIVTGTTAHGAVLHTATAAGFRKYNVILPIDCLSAADLYTEQATVHLLKTGPATRKRIQITRSDMISIQR